MNPLETYLQSLYDIYSSGAGVPETSGYGALANLFNEVGKSLKPRVRCLINIANKGAGLPDGGLFTPDQFQKRAKGELIEGSFLRVARLKSSQLRMTSTRSLRANKFAVTSNVISKSWSRTTVTSSS
jgi:hypothetical protein